jgi:glutaredoxin
VIVIFSKDGCQYCDKAKALLDTYEIDYAVANVDTSQEAMDFVKERGHTSVPQIYNGIDLLVAGGFNGLAEMSREEILERVM